MNLEVFQSGEALIAGGTAVRFLIGVSTDVNQHLVPGIKPPSFACTPFPVATVARILLWLHMEVVDMIHQVLQGVEK